MHPDLKVGLALTLLIVGFAAAMCFRHSQPEVVARQDDLTNDAKLYAEMDLLPIRTYDQNSPETSSADLVASGAADQISINDGPLEVPEPIATTEDAGSGVSAGDQAQPASTTQTYTVRSGDTLSGIAATFLGSTQRYGEIFEANRHLLNSPDDLRPGMQLVIPPRDGAPMPTAAEQPSVSAAELQVDAIDAEPTPALASPFTPMVPR